MMIRRVLAGAAAAVVVAVVPTAAFAVDYAGTDEGTTVSDTNPAPGEPFSVSVDAGPDSSEATLTVTSSNPNVPDSDIEIAGTQSMTKATNAQGVAQFTVTLRAEGSYTLAGFDENGQPVGQSVVVVGDGTLGEATTDDSSTAGAGLPNTGLGSGTALIAGGGSLLLLAGGTTMVAARRRKVQVG